MNLYILKYNNYNNRIVKGHATIDEYIPTGTSFWFQQHVSFNPNTGITTTQVINHDVSMYDYLIAVNEHWDEDEGYIEDGINSRWYIINCTRIRDDQYNLELQRDLMYDYIDDIKQSTCFIDRCNVRQDDSAIFNPEPVQYNQVKHVEDRLYDGSNCLWIVGYVPRTIKYQWDYDEETQTYAHDIETDDYTLRTKASANLFTADYEFDDVADLEAQYPELYAMLYEDAVSRQYEIQDDIDISFNNVTLRQLVSLIQGPMYKAEEFHTNSLSRYSPYNLFNADGTFNNSYKVNSKLAGNFRVTAVSDPKYYFNQFANYIKENIELTNISDIETDLDIGGNNDYSSVINTFEGKVIKVGSDVFRLSSSSHIEYVEGTASACKSMLCNALHTTIQNYNLGVGRSHIVEYSTSSDSYNSNPTATQLSAMNIGLKLKTVAYNLYKDQLNVEVSVKITNNQDRQHCVDAQYDMFCIPWEIPERCYNGQFSFGNNIVIEFGGEPHRKGELDPACGLAIAQAIAPTLGTSNLYDLQILPYCPLNNAVGRKTVSVVGKKVTGEHWIADLDDRDDYEEIKVGDNIVSYLFWCSNSTFHRTLMNNRINQIGTNLYSSGGAIWHMPWEYSEAYKYEAGQEPNATQIKMQMNCFKVRLSGGNYASMFDFTPAMNGGVDTFEIYCDYKPFNPYIKVNPTWSNLYGYNLVDDSYEPFQDARGLILSGDFSLTIISDAWTNYQLQNKNYQAMFDNNIKTTETQFYNSFSAQKMSAITGYATSTMSALAGMGSTDKDGKSTVSGAQVLTKAWNTALSAANTGYSLATSAANQNIALANQRKQFEYQLDNIKSLPQTIQKVSSMTQTNKVVPLLEGYSCTPEEEQQFLFYLSFNGMTYGRIAVLGNIFSSLYGTEQGFVQGNIIHSELPVAANVFNEINRLLQTGVRFNLQ